MPAASHADGLVASVVDIGSNSVLSLVVTVDGAGRARQADAAIVTTRLGGGLPPGGCLEPAARARTREAVVDLVARGRARGAALSWAFATGAARRARDGRAFAIEIARAAACPVEILPAEEEAALAFAAVAHAAGEGEHALLVVDVGGATTELTLGRGARIGDWVSLPLGALAGSGAEVAALATRALSATALPAAARAAGAALVASGGTATVLAALALDLPAYDPARVHGHTLAVDELAPQAARARLVAGVLDPGRADILPAGAAILEAVARAAGVAAVRVSEHGVRHGYLRSRLARQGIVADLRTLWA